MKKIEVIGTKEEWMKLGLICLIMDTGLRIMFGALKNAGIVRKNKSDGRKR